MPYISPPEMMWETQLCGPVLAGPRRGGSLGDERQESMGMGCTDPFKAGGDLETGAIQSKESNKSYGIRYDESLLSL